MEIRRSTYFVLAALLDGPLHGYAIIGRAAELSDGEVRLSTGTLFGALDRLVDSGLVEAGEEEKVETETRKILGCLRDGRVDPHPIVISAQTTRVGVQNGHTGSISVGFEHPPSADAIIDAWRTFKGRPQELGLPSAPPQPIVYLTEQNRPQPALDVNQDGGMRISIGRLRPCPVLDFKFIALGHNTIRGAAGAAILNAELMRAEGFF